MTANRTSGAPQALLRRLRQVMAKEGRAEDRLRDIVRVIASNMVAEVCSIYLLRRKSLVLVATEGLKQEATGRTTLKLGEGLVGDIAKHARPLNFTDVRAHSNFAYRPETGEDPFSSLMGVPILRSGRTLGVLVVQNKAKRHYTPEEVEVLQTVAMVLAELVFSEKLLDPEEAGLLLRRDTYVRKTGQGLANGIASGHVVLHEPRIQVTHLIAEDIGQETGRLDEAIGQLRDSVDQMLSSTGRMLPSESREVLEAYRMFAYDRGWMNRLREAVMTGLTAEAAVERVQNDTRARMARQRDPYIRERLHDLDDLANRLLRHLTGATAGGATKVLPDDAVLLARSMGPAELLDYDRKKLKGLVLEEGSPTSHVTIVARALGIPMIGRADDLLELCDQGDRIIIDGESGNIHLRPGPDIDEAFNTKQALIAQRRAQFDALRNEPAVSLDGVNMTLRVNAGLLFDLPHLKEAGADGIGLFRTELQFMVSSTMPRLSAQKKLYKEVLDAADDLPVIFRTLDLGGDKVLPYGIAQEEENPALGWRALRIALDRPALLRYQVRALLAAAEDRQLNIMFPMVAEVSEFVEARKLVDLEVERVHRMGRPLPREIRVGTMLEVPSLAWQVDALMPIVDFISIGSNDLIQFMFACDRGNARVAGRYDPLSPPVLSFLRYLVRKARDHEVEIALCGEMAGRPLEAMALIGLGFRVISMPPASVGPVKVMVRSLHVRELETFTEQLIDLPDHSVRSHLQSFAHDQGVAI